MGLRTVLLVASSLLCANFLCAQVNGNAGSPRSDLFARLSYYETGQFGPICVAVKPGGDYRAILTVNGGILHLQGKMPVVVFDRLTTLLSSSDFRVLSGDHGGLLRQRAESFGAEVLHSEATDSKITVYNRLRTQRLQWLNPDGENPFPVSVLKVVRWLKDFKPTNAQDFVYSEFPDVCPSGGLRLLQPAIASSQP